MSSGLSVYRTAALPPADERGGNRIVEALQGNALDNIAALHLLTEPAELAALDESRRLLRAGHVETADVVGEFYAVLQDHLLRPAPGEVQRHFRHGQPF